MFQNSLWNLLGQNKIIPLISNSIHSIGIHPSKPRESAITVATTCDSAFFNPSGGYFCRIDFGTNRLEVEIFQLRSVACFEDILAVSIICVLYGATYQYHRGSLLTLLEASKFWFSASLVFN